MSVNWQLLDRPYFTKRIVFVWVLAMFTYTIWWFMDFAQNSTRPGTDVAAIIGAINLPLSFLLGKLSDFWKEVPPPTP